MITSILIVGMLMSGHSSITGSQILWAKPTASLTSVRLDTQEVHAKDFEQVILAELLTRYGKLHHEATVQILFPREVVNVPKGNLRLEIGDWSGGGRTGRRSFRVKVFVNRQFIQTIHVVSEVKAQAEVATPIRWLTPQKVIAPEDLANIMVDVPSLTHDFVMNLEEAVGKQVLRPLPPRQPIRKPMLDYPPVIKRGDRVMIEVRKGGLFVQALGIAKAAGKAGDTIIIQNQASGRDVLGTVVSSGLVEIGF